MTNASAAQSDIELYSLPDNGRAHPGVSRETLPNRDALEHARVGKKEVLKRRFRLARTIGFASSIMITWKAMTIPSLTPCLNGGPAAMTYGYLAVWIAFFSIFITMGELASMIPSAGGQYHWTSILAPSSSRRFLSFITGSISVIAWTVTATSNYIVAANLVQSTVVLGLPNYDAKAWQATLMTCGILLLALFVVIYLSMIFPVIKVFLLIAHIFGFFAVLIALVYLGPSAGLRSGFTQTLDYGGWHNIGLATFVGLQGTVVAFMGMDGAIHMAEEVENSSLVVPQSMLLAILLNGSLGFAMLIAILSKSGDLHKLLTTDTKFLFMFILENSLQSKSAAIILSSMFCILSSCAAFALIAAGSRMLWSFCRERAFPGWRWLRQVDRRTSVPNHSTFIIVLAACLIGLVDIGAPFVLTITLSLVLQGCFFSYLIPLSLLLYRRVKGQIAESEEDGGDSKPFTWGPFRLKGWVEAVNNALAIVFIVVMLFFGLAITGGMILLAVVYYFA
ncbi:choline transport protein [Aspergillus homomorphus CBS 101889]|uniref:Choline transport protein n=1 Tax=Aspergillus homomorphus (strain CBS 101889) TaxID=1450537 RepID=A0A395IC80_ASPHC|nr:choline transport protein [Aspergillus homomorphus CBS 101889]RAL17656.1 choline transport protein [Aspergillus homomorphus CBS 101889]